MNAKPGTVSAKPASPELSRSMRRFFRDDLRIILAKLTKLRRLCAPKDLSQIEEALSSLTAFSVGKCDQLPLQTSDATNPKGAGDCEVFLAEMAGFCQSLQAEWTLLGARGQSQLRTLLRRLLVHKPNRMAQEVQWDEVAIAGFGVITWVTVFSVGYTVSAKPYELVLKQPGSLGAGISEIGAVLGSLFMFILASVPTNTLLLACIAGCLGTAYRRAKSDAVADHRAHRAQDYMFAVTASFFVYLALLAGLMTLTVADSITNESQEKQIQLAGTVSICAFLVGYDRNILVWMLQKAAKLLTSTDDQSDRRSSRTHTTNGLENPSHNTNPAQLPAKG